MRKRKWIVDCSVITMAAMLSIGILPCYATSIDDDSNAIKVKAHFTAYYPWNNSMEGGYYDALGNLLDTSHPTMAAPSNVPFHTKIEIQGTGTSRDGTIYEVLDRGGGINVEGDTYHFDILMSSNDECNTWGDVYGYAIIGANGELTAITDATGESSSGGSEDSSIFGRLQKMTAWLKKKVEDSLSDIFELETSQIYGNGETTQEEE